MTPYNGRTMRAPAGIAALLLLGGCVVASGVSPPPPGAAAGQPELRQRGAVAGQAHPIDYVYAVDPTCKSEGDTAIRMLTPPGHGAITTEPGEDYPNFPKDNVRSACDTVKVPVLRLIYTPQPGFVGADNALVQFLTPLGSVRNVRYEIDVR